MNENLKFGITGEFPCNYIPNQQERLLVAVDERLHNNEQYAWLMNQGFRRSGDQIYRPHCVNCQACQSLRILTQHFMPSKSQKRLLKKNQHFDVRISREQNEQYFPLYERYINTLHNDGSMYPANKEQYESFLTCSVTQQLFLEVWDGDKLISVAVTDDLPDALSAVYTFYDPEYRKSGLGVFSILNQIAYTKKSLREYLYLGYQIDECKKMNYKNKYFPYQRLSNNQWKTTNK